MIDGTNGEEVALEELALCLSWESLLNLSLNSTVDGRLLWFRRGKKKIHEKRTTQHKDKA